MRCLLTFLLLLTSLSIDAAGLDQLKTFLAQTHTARGTFSQAVISRSGRKPKQSSGRFSFARPGKFRWVYEKPYAQLLVGDGNRFWSYDRDLDQVTVKKIGDAVGSSPAALLAGESLEKNFDLKEDGSEGTLTFIEARPKAQDATFSRVRMGFLDNLPKVMEIRDNFGQTTVLRFDRFEPNPVLAASEFRFTPPPGADVVGD